MTAEVSGNMFFIIRLTWKLLDVDLAHLVDSKCWLHSYLTHSIDESNIQPKIKLIIDYT